MATVSGPSTSSELGAALRDFCVAQLDVLARQQLPGLALPRTYAGHVVGADVRADLLYTLGHLADAGVVSIADVAIDDHIVTHLRQVQGAHTHTFFSYRVAETIGRAGTFANNRYLETLSTTERNEVAVACSSTDWIALLDQGSLPRNYAAVLARCEHARLALGLDVDPSVLQSLVDRLHDFLGSNPRLYLDDSHDRNGRYDIYTADVWLFCEPLAPRLDGLWERGIATALELVDAVGARDGTAIAWGRSTGVLSIALTIELAALAISRGMVAERSGAWLTRGIDALDSMRSCYGSGVVNAHQYRDQDAYRGPARRLQLTFDVLGKLAWAAKSLLNAPAPLSLVDNPTSGVGTARTFEARAGSVGADGGSGDDRAGSVDHLDAYPRIDRVIAFEVDRPAGVWAYRDEGVEFVLPFVGAARSHYYPSLHSPGCFEVPVDADLPCWTPLVHAGVGRYASGGVPTSVEHQPHTVRATWDGFVPTTFDWNKAAPEPFAGTRSAQYAITGRAVRVTEELRFEAAPDAVTVMIPEIAERPLQVIFETTNASTAIAIDVQGVKEWRSSWSEIAIAHQLDIEPSTAIDYTITVTPKIRVASTAFSHHYHDSLYNPIVDRVIAYPNPLGPIGDVSIDLANIDVFHLHWPEFVGFERLVTHEDIIQALQRRGIPIVWTAHNLTPHTKQPEIYDPVYALWAQHADAVIHHSNAGQRLMRSRYVFRDDCIHEVIPHGHFGELWSDVASIDRGEAERELGFAPCPIRIGIVGAPRMEKHVQKFLDGFAMSSRADVQLACWSLAPHDHVPDDPRIVAGEPYRLVRPALYAQRLAVCDVLALPFDPDGEMLATGTAADALGLGLPALTSEWEYLIETLGAAAIVVGQEPAAIGAAIDSLSDTTLAAARAAVVERRVDYEWPQLAERTADLFDHLLRTQPKPPHSVFPGSNV